MVYINLFLMKYLEWFSVVCIGSFKVINIWQFFYWCNQNSICVITVCYGFIIEYMNCTLWFKFIQLEFMLCGIIRRNVDLSKS